MGKSLRSPLSSFDAQCQTVWGWQPTVGQRQHLQALYREVITASRQFNLTRITDPQAFGEKHLWDSLWGIAPWLSGDSLNWTHPPGETMPWGKLPLGIEPAQSLQAIDIGTGAGFPGVPIAMVQPDWRVTLLDATRKKITFLEQLRRTLKLDNITPLCDRAEQIGQNHLFRNQFDLALIRAVSTAPVCAEYTLPLLKVGGIAILYRGQWTPAETTELEQCLTQLGGAIAALRHTHTPLTGAHRHCVYLQKQQPTPAQFPRRVGTPQRSPLRSRM